MCFITCWGEWKNLLADQSTFSKHWSKAKTLKIQILTKNSTAFGQWLVQSDKFQICHPDRLDGSDWLPLPHYSLQLSYNFPMLVETPLNISTATRAHEFSETASVSTRTELISFSFSPVNLDKCLFLLFLWSGKHILILKNRWGQQLCFNLCNSIYWSLDCL